jgi:hypothetical protein
MSSLHFSSLHAKWLVGIAGGAACATFAYVTFDGDSSVEREPQPTEQPAEQSASEARTSQHTSVRSTRAPTCEFRSGDQVSYELRLSETSTIDLSKVGMMGGANAAGTKPVSVEQTTSATLDLEALSDTDEHTLLLGRFRRVDNSAVRQDDELQVPFLVRVTQECAVDGFAYQQDAKLPYARIQQAIVYELQWSWPDGKTEEFQGRNALGTYEARVATRTRDQKTLVDRRVVDYEPWRAGQGMVARVEDSLMTVEPGEGAWFDKLVLRERIRGEHSSTKRSVVATRVEAPADALAGQSTNEAHYVWADLLPAELALPAQHALTRRELEARAQARKLTLQEAVDSFVDRVRDDEVGIQDTWPPLRTYLEARPEATEAVVNQLKRVELPAEATMGVYIALGNARTDQAKEALEGILRDENAPVIERSRAALSLIDRDDVGPSTARYLSANAAQIADGKNRAARILGRQSMLALGAMSGRHPYDPQIKDIAVQRISQSLQTLSHPLHLRPVFGALANIGDASLLNMVEDFTHHHDPETREYAAIVFRRMSPAETAEMASQWLARETNWNVKRALYNTIELQTFDARENASRGVLAQAVRDLTNEKAGVITRKAIVRLLARARADMEKDDLGIGEAFLEQIPYEIEQDTGLYLTMAEHVDAPRLDKVTVATIDRINNNRINNKKRSAANQPSAPDQGSPGGSYLPGQNPTNASSNPQVGPQ